MLKKIAVLAAFIFAAIPLAPSATAWDEVCLRLQPWPKTWYIGYFNVVIGEPDVAKFFPAQVGGVRTPNSLIYNVPQHLRKSVPGWRDHDPRTREHHRSEEFLAGQHHCIKIGHVPPGDGFQVYVATSTHHVAHCPPHPDHAPNAGYAQERGQYRKIWFEAWGTIHHPGCKFGWETN